MLHTHIYIYESISYTIKFNDHINQYISAVLLSFPFSLSLSYIYMYIYMYIYICICIVYIHNFVHMLQSAAILAVLLCFGCQVTARGASTDAPAPWPMGFMGKSTGNLTSLSNIAPHHDTRWIVSNIFKPPVYRQYLYIYIYIHM